MLVSDSYSLWQYIKVCNFKNKSIFISFYFAVLNLWAWLEKLTDPFGRISLPLSIAPVSKVLKTIYFDMKTIISNLSTCALRVCDSTRKISTECCLSVDCDASMTETVEC